MTESIALEILLHEEPGVKFLFRVSAVHSQMMGAPIHYDASFTDIEVRPMFRTGLPVYSKLGWGLSLEREVIHKSEWYTSESRFMES
jgi:hypothetical protein